MEGLAAVQRSSTCFFNIPLEIRHQIYHYCLVRGSCITVNHHYYDSYYSSNWSVDKVKSLLLVSKKVSQEATDILYGSNIFRCILDGDGGYCLKQMFTEANRRKIRKLQVVMRPMGCFYQPGKEPDSGL